MFGKNRTEEHSHIVPFYIDISHSLLRTEEFSKCIVIKMKENSGHDTYRTKHLAWVTFSQRVQFPVGLSKVKQWVHFLTEILFQYNKVRLMVRWNQCL